eukprot:gene2732-biopygen2254
MKQLEIVNNTSKLQEIVWDDRNRIDRFKSKSSESLLILSKTGDKESDEKNPDIVEKVVINNGIKVNNSFNDKKGNLVVASTSKDSKLQLQEHMRANKIPFKCPKEKSTAISIVGFKKELSIQEALNTITAQNSFITTESEAGETGGQ